MKATLRAATLAVLAGAAAPAAALAQGGQAAVYDPLPPPGSAYVRFVNALGGELALKPDFLPAQRLGTEPAGRVTPYAVVEKVAGRSLRLEASLGGRSGQAALKAEPGSYVTVILHRAADGGVAATPVVDQPDFNRARARLSFYNAAPDCPAASLAIEDGPVVFDGVAAGTAKARSVNPVTAQLKASCAAQAAPGVVAVWPISGAHRTTCGVPCSRSSAPSGPIRAMSRWWRPRPRSRPS
jgi:hypothetical protein